MELQCLGLTEEQSHLCFVQPARAIGRYAVGPSALLKQQVGIEFTIAHLLWAQMWLP